MTFDFVRHLINRFNITVRLCELRIQYIIIDMSIALSLVFASQSSYACDLGAHYEISITRTVVYIFIYYIIYNIHTL